MLYIFFLFVWPSSMFLSTIRVNQKFTDLVTSLNPLALDLCLLLKKMFNPRQSFYKLIYLISGIGMLVTGKRFENVLHMGTLVRSLENGCEVRAEVLKKSRCRIWQFSFLGAA